MPARRSRSNRRQRQRGGAGKLQIIPVEALKTQKPALNAANATAADVGLAATQGAQLLDEWLGTHAAEIKKITDLFDDQGEPDSEEMFPGKLLGATAFNDLYKWTMLPVVRKLEALKVGESGPMAGLKDGITVTFGIDLRDPKMREALRKGKTAANAKILARGSLEESIDFALRNKLAPRRFDKDLFNYVLTGPRVNILNVDDIEGAKEATVNAICDKPLIDMVMPFGEKYDHTHTCFDRNKVVVSFYYDPEVKDNEGNAGTHFIEATGPWHRVTWLETSMMQTVYEAKLKHDLNVTSDPEAYGKWLYGALLRCAKSVAYTRIIQKSKAIPGTLDSPYAKAPVPIPPPMVPALFTGRRTGGLAFILLQNLFHADHFEKLANPMPHVTVGGKEDGKTYSLGTSSCEAGYILEKKLGLRCLPLAGTHAHELSMVTSILYPDLDKKERGGPATTQVIGHYLYGKYVWAKTGRVGPLPMLPDTLGTRVFLTAANKYKVHNLFQEGENATQYVPLIDLIMSGRQDSGNLEHFKKNMIDGGYTKPPPNQSQPKGMMASEIDDTKTLSKAAAEGYASFGAGGFFGDSEKVWAGATDDNKKYGSMAVKAVRVLYKKEGIDLSDIPYMEAVEDKDLVVGYPVKIGDADDGYSPALTAKDKLSIDKNKDDAFVARVKTWASDIRFAAGKPGTAIKGTVDPVNLKTVFDERTPTGRVGAAGGRRRNSRRNNRSSSRSSTRRNRRY